MARPDELYGKLKGLIHEVLDREKAMGLDVAFIKHGLTLENHGRPVTTLIDKEMDGMKLPTTLDQPAWWSELPSKPAERRSVVPVLSLKQEEEKLQDSILASPTKQIEESHETEPEPTSLCLKLEEEEQIAEAECGYVPDQRKQEEKVPGGSSNALELVLSIVEQGDSLKSLICEFLIRPMNQLRVTKQKLAVVKKMPKLENEYGDHYKRPPDPMQNENQVIMSIGQGESIEYMLRQPWLRRLWSKWREAFSAAAGYELNGKESFVCYILRHVRSLEMIEQGSKSLLKHGKGLQSWWKLPRLKPEAATKPTTLDQPAWWSELPSKPAERRSVVPVLSLKQEEEKLQDSILASPTKQIEESHETEPEPTSLCLKLEEEEQIAEAECGVPDQRKQEEKVPEGHLMLLNWCFLLLSKVIALRV
ncbi:hypothetical protein Bca52824_026795 [Brassica carinata]|uniref:Uncharacterized protein n=1 Tax=Brassica carinata TaxID=52824 RepID=A0A8X7SJ65_BRACI|nr:hypothetical protein Bca52824_026795 [Brassica carinata]